MALTSMPRIERLHLADLVLPEGHPGATGPGQRAVVYGFAIDHPEGVILVDTGVGPAHPLIDELYAPSSTDLDAALAARGIEPDRVVAVINSHLHFDHCGQNPRYYGTSVPVFVQEEEVAAADEPFYTVPEWATVPSGQLRALRGDHDVAEGVRILSTPGHTRGHQSVVVEAVDEVVVIGAQTVWDTREFHDEIASPANVDDDELREAAVDSIRRLKSLRPVAAYFSHSAEVYRAR